MLNFFQEYGAAIQAISSIILLIVTIMYVKATYRMIHSSQESHIRPVQFKYENGQNILFIKNFGPGIAINVQVFAEPSEVLDNDESTQLIYLNEALNILYNVFRDNFVKAKANSFEIVPNDCTEFIFKHKINTNSPVLLSWETVTGEKKHKLIRLKIDNDGKINILKVNKYGIRKSKNLLLKLIFFLINILDKGTFGQDISFEDYIKNKEKKKHKKQNKQK